MIRLTFISENQRSESREFDTDDLAEAVIAYAERSFRLKPEEEGAATNRGPDTWIIAFIVERDGKVMPHEEVVSAFKHISDQQYIFGPRP